MEQPRIYVIGAMAGVGSYRHISDLVRFLGQCGFQYVSHPQQKPIDHARDWRKAGQAELHTLFHDLSTFIRDSTDVLVAHLHHASDGRILEMILAKLHGKPVIGFAPNPINSPWRLLYATEVVTSHGELVAALVRL